MVNVASQLLDAVRRLKTNCRKRINRTGLGVELIVLPCLNWAISQFCPVTVWLATMDRLKQFKQYDSHMFWFFSFSQPKSSTHILDVLCFISYIDNLHNKADWFILNDVMFNFVFLRWALLRCAKWFSCLTCAWWWRCVLSCANSWEQDPSSHLFSQVGLLFTRGGQRVWWGFQQWRLKPAFPINVS